MFLYICTNINLSTIIFAQHCILLLDHEKTTYPYNIQPHNITPAIITR